MIDEIILKKNSRILFIGDSITDVGRNRKDELNLGEGFPSLIAQKLIEKYPNHNLTILNRGISGDQVIDLKNRWSEDCLTLKPDLVTILVGINDVGFVINEKLLPTTEELAQFETDYRSLLESLQSETNAKIVLMEPFVLPYPADRLNWRDQLDPRIEIVSKLAKEFNALLIPLDDLLNTKGMASTFEKYTGEDGVHPTLLGHEAIADAWLSYVSL